MRKQKEVLSGQVHLVEIDLLRAGEHTTAVPEDRLRKEAGTFDYHVCVHHFDNLEDYYVYPILLEQRLPEIDIPLLPGDGAVTLNLQQVFGRCYETGPYQRRLDYRSWKLEPPLTGERTPWAERLVSSRR